MRSVFHPDVLASAEMAGSWETGRTLLVLGAWAVGGWMWGGAEEADSIAAIRAGIDHGATTIDTAAVYGNEEGVGKAIAESGLARAELFITTKLWNENQGYDSTLKAFDESLTRLGLDYVDLYLIHWPLPAKDKYVETWKAFQELHADGRAKAIGVSNFPAEHLERLIGETSVIPAVNQIELHPQLQQTELRAFHAERAAEAQAQAAAG